MVNKIFDGVKVVDFAWQIEGPMITAAMASCGAEVIKVESMAALDRTRVMPPFLNNLQVPDHAYEFSNINPGKMSLTANLNNPRGRELVKKLIKRADIVNESFVAGTLEKWGLGYEDLTKVKPDIIVISSSTFGQTGPFATQPGFGGTLTALSGIRHLTGWSDGPPQEPAWVYTDWVVCKIGLLVAVAALDYKRRTGKGQHIDAAQYEAMEHLLTPVFLNYVATGNELSRIGNRSTVAAPHGVYRCRGERRYCCITVFTDEEWKHFCKVIGKPQWIESPKFATLVNRLRNVDELDKSVEEWTLIRSPEEVMELMQGTGIASAVVQNAEDLDKDPQLIHRHFYWDLEHPVLGNMTTMGWPVKFSKTPYEITRSPCLGEHNFFICTELLKMSDEEFVELAASGVFE